jgi:hypothetical protein
MQIATCFDILAIFLQFYAQNIIWNSFTYFLSPFQNYEKCGKREFPNFY